MHQVMHATWLSSTLMLRFCSVPMSHLTQPAFVVPTNDIEHVHFERVNPNGRNFDLKLITKANIAVDLPPSDPLTINMIEQRYLNQIMGWLVVRVHVI